MGLLKIYFTEKQQQMILSMCIVSVVSLLQKNYANPPEEQLPIRCFDLDLNLRKQRTEEAKHELIRTKQHLESLCKAQDNLCQLIKRETWDKLEIKRKHIKAFLGEFEVENYALLPANKRYEQQLRKLLDHKAVVSHIAKGECLEPWIPKSDSKHKLGTKVITDQTASEKIREAMLEAEDEKEEPEIVEEPHVFSGSSSHKYVELSPYLGSQFETSSYLQMQEETVFLQKVKIDLRHYFNKKFNAMVSLKEKEMNVVWERNKRLRYILSELNNKEKIIIDPAWTPKEKPETIITVEDNEVKAKPYISPSEQEILDKLAAEEEARRLAELADDFRERALVDMMDGVLELLWEHIIKRDIPKPACMLEKQPEEYNEDDIRAVKEYEEKVAFLMSERERYRQMLESEFKTLSNTVREGMLKFDNQLSELFLLKILIQSCIDQAMLKILRARQRCHQRMLLDRQEKEIISNVEKTQQKIEKLHETIRSLQDVTTECRSVYEGYVTRDRNLDKNFKRDFPDLSQFHCDQLYKTYKKRPKMQQKAQLSVVLLNELSQNSLTADKPSFLPPEYVDFLKGLDNLDNHSHAPPNIDEDTWNTLCRVRRTKIECELKIKAMALELAEAEKTVAVFQKQLSAEKENHAKLLSSLKNLREEKLYQCHNMQIQVVMKQGMVEIPTTGSLSDFDDAILINRTDVENINALILEAGKKKLDAMHEATNFRRGNICLEWEHKTMCMKIEDLQDELKTIESVKVTKEMQEYLKRSAKGESDTKGLLPVDKEIAIIKDQYEKKLRELDKMAKEIDMKITAVRKENGALDKKILEMNVVVNEQQLSRDLESEAREAQDSKKLLETIMKRNRMVAKIQKQHNEILVLQTELELLRLKTYPTLKYTTLT
ncbi:cilia- and flagella-associated protein 43 [Schistocerca americana]|uniref:cilia- and flagella-associated protein 43 n=1 Tax=Schistocerca americana TaxID=7009 RepID=UPI001F4F50D3|nr:cilia- and flagella-associated protein 43 [Schistocerca americana]